MEYTVVGYFPVNESNFVATVVAKNPKDAEKKMAQVVDKDAELSAEHDGEELPDSSELVIVAVFKGRLKPV